MQHIAEKDDLEASVQDPFTARSTLMIIGTPSAALLAAHRTEHVLKSCSFDYSDVVCTISASYQVTEAQRFQVQKSVSIYDATREIILVLHALTEKVSRL